MFEDSCTGQPRASEIGTEMTTIDIDTATIDIDTATSKGSCSPGQHSKRCTATLKPEGPG